MEPRVAELAALLERTPAVLDAWLRALPDPWLDADEGPGTFSPREVVGHLIQGEVADWIPRARRILEHGESLPFEPFDRLAQRAEPARPIGEQLERLAALRADNLRALRELELTSEDLDARGTHPALGPVTLGELLATWAAHDLSHLRQIARCLAGRLEDRVGPWDAYMPLIAEARAKRSGAG